jgi:hypothetical protein
MKGLATMSTLGALVALDVRSSGYDYPDNLDYLGACINSFSVVEFPGGGDARAVFLPEVGRRGKGLSDEGTDKGTGKGVARALRPSRQHQGGRGGCLGTMVQGESSLSVLLGRGRLSLVCRSAGEEARHTLSDIARPRQGVEPVA